MRRAKKIVELGAEIFKVLHKEQNLDSAPRVPMKKYRGEGGR